MLRALHIDGGPTYVGAVDQAAPSKAIPVSATGRPMVRSVGLGSILEFAVWVGEAIRLFECQLARLCPWQCRVGLVVQPWAREGGLGFLNPLPEMWTEIS